MFCNVSFNFATAILKFDTFSSYHIVQTRITFSLFAHRNSYVPKTYFTLYHNSLLSHPKLLPFGALQTEGRMDNILHPLLPKLFFFSLSARGPTRRRNSTGLAELWDGWLIERASLVIGNFNDFSPLLAFDS